MLDMKTHNPETQHIIFDLDETLWQNHNYFWKSNREYGTMLNTLMVKHGIPNTPSAEKMTDIFNEWDLQRAIETKEISQERYYSSMIGCAHHYLGFIPPFLHKQIHRLVAETINTDCERIEVEAVLSDLISMGYGLVCYTSGSYTSQIEKLRRNRMLGYFDHAIVSNNKCGEDLQRVIDMFQLNPVAYIGNSMKSDILTANQCGVPAYLINDPAWGYCATDQADLQYTRVQTLQQFVRLMGELRV